MKALSTGNGSVALLAVGSPGHVPVVPELLVPLLLPLLLVVPLLVVVLPASDPSPDELPELLVVPASSEVTGGVLVVDDAQAV
jgi:hypothetical protein